MKRVEHVSKMHINPNAPYEKAYYSYPNLLGQNTVVFFDACHYERRSNDTSSSQDKIISVLSSQVQSLCSNDCFSSVC